MVAAAPDADLADLGTLVGTVVRVGGLVVDLAPDGFVLDDGTATGRIVLAGQAAEWLDLVEPADAINVTGRVTARPDGEPAVVVDDPAAITLGSALDEAGPSATPAGPAASADVPSAVLAGLGDGPVGLPGMGAGLAGLVGVSVVSLAVTALRRRHARHLLAIRVAARLAALGARSPSGRPAQDRPSGP
jgi:hypothetical protein